MSPRPSNARRLLVTGLAGTALTALCCFTPVLVILLGAVGAASLAVYLDAVLFPLLGFFLLLSLVGAWRYFRKPAAPEVP
jgi:mercuric ion transport protein